MQTEYFRNIWLPLSSQFYRIAFYMLENEQDAEDVVQDMYIRLWNMKDNGAAVLNPRSYGIRILKNLCIDRIRSRRPDSADCNEILETVASGSVPDEVLIDRETLSDVRKYMDSLSEKQRMVLEMRTEQDKEYRKIAKATGLTELNVRVTLSQARKALRKMLEDKI